MTFLSMGKRTRILACMPTPKPRRSVCAPRGGIFLTADHFFTGGYAHVSHPSFPSAEAASAAQGPYAASGGTPGKPKPSLFHAWLDHAGAGLGAQSVAPSRVDVPHGVHGQ